MKNLPPFAKFLLVLFVVVYVRRILQEAYAHPQQDGTLSTPQLLSVLAAGILISLVAWAITAVASGRWKR